MGILDTCIRTMKSRLSRHLFRYPQANITRAVAGLVKSWNNTYNKRLEMSPSQARSPILDPILRKRLFPKEKLLPFDIFLKRTLRLVRKTNLPRKKGEVAADPTSWKTWRVGDHVMIDYKPHYLTRGLESTFFLLHTAKKLSSQATMSNVGPSRSLLKCTPITIPMFIS